MLFRRAKSLEAPLPEAPMADAQPAPDSAAATTSTANDSGKNDSDNSAREILELIEIDLSESIIECFDDSCANLSIAAIRALHHFDPRMFVRISRENLRRGVGASVIDDDPKRGANGLLDDAVERHAHEFRFITTGRDENVAARFLGRGAAKSDSVRACRRDHGAGRI